LLRIGTPKGRAAASVVYSRFIFPEPAPVRVSWESPMRRMPCLAAALSLTVLAACDKGAADSRNLAALDAELMVDNQADPLGNRIMVDPRRLAGGQRSTPGTTPAPAAPGTAPAERLTTAPPAKRAGACPECDAARRTVSLGQRQGMTPVECTRTLTYGADWAKRLPPDLPLHPQARITEAAGSQDAGCRFRVVSFTIDAPLPQMVDWYYTRATRAGYASGHQLDGKEHVLAGSRGRDGGIYVLFLSPKGPRTSIDMVLNKGI
jgi:hypothetical protein